MAAGRHANTLLEGMPALVLLALLLVLPVGGVEPLIWGTLAGFACQLVALSVPLRRRREIERPRLGVASPHWPAFWQGFSIMLAGQALMSLTTVADLFFAAHLDVGAIATLGYANRILALVLGLGALAVTRGTLPVFSRAQVHDSRHAFQLARQWALMLLGLGAAAMIAGWLAAPWLVGVFFERGAFTASNTRAVTEVLCYGLVQLPFYFSGLVFASYLSSRGLYIWLLWSGVVGLSAKLIGNLLFIPLYGVSGIALATALTYAANFLLFVAVFYKVGKTV
jgi:peptidoglycan biosynthesis protein MviN/MurJ (putative lipid II flippase)